MTGKVVKQNIEYPWTHGFYVLQIDIFMLSNYWLYILSTLIYTVVQVS